METCEKAQAPAEESPDRAALRGFASIAGELTAAQRQGRDLDHVLNLIAAEIAALVRAPRVSLYLRDPESGVFRGQVGFGADDRLIKRLTGGVHADRFTREVAQTKQPVVLADAMTDPRAISSTMREWGVVSVMGVPMVLSDEVIGILFADSKDERREFTAEDREVASAFATLAAIAVQQAQLTSDLRGALRRLRRRAAAGRPRVRRGRRAADAGDVPRLRRLRPGAGRVGLRPDPAHGDRRAVPAPGPAPSCCWRR